MHAPRLGSGLLVQDLYLSEMPGRAQSVLFEPDGQLRHNRPGADNSGQDMQVQTGSGHLALNRERRGTVHTHRQPEPGECATAAKHVPVMRLTSLTRPMSEPVMWKTSTELRSKAARLLCTHRSGTRGGGGELSALPQA